VFKRGGQTRSRISVPAVQVKDCALALANGTGGQLGSRHGSATLILERA